MWKGTNSPMLSNSSRVYVWGTSPYSERGIFLLRSPRDVFNKVLTGRFVTVLLTRHMISCSRPITNNPDGGTREVPIGVTRTRFLFLSEKQPPRLSGSHTRFEGRRKLLLHRTNARSSRGHAQRSRRTGARAEVYRSGRIHWSIR